MLTVKVNNLPNYANNYNFIVARAVDEELWFYGAWDDFEKAQSVASEIDGIVVQRC